MGNSIVQLHVQNTVHREIKCAFLGPRQLHVAVLVTLTV